MSKSRVSKLLKFIWNTFELDIFKPWRQICLIPRKWQMVLSMIYTLGRTSDARPGGAARPRIQGYFFKFTEFWNQRVFAAP